MSWGEKGALLFSCVALTGCAASTTAVEVRPIADPAAALRQGGDEVAAARGQLMLGNAGLALEGFRKAQRDNPSNPAALAGIGDCYVAMGRFDIAQTNYEAALALAPHDRTLLLGLAAIFDREGFVYRAMAARAEAGAAVQAAPTIARQAQASVPEVAEPAIPPVPQRVDTPVALSAWSVAPRAVTSLAFSAPTILAPITSSPPAASPAVNREVVAEAAPFVPTKPLVALSASSVAPWAGTSLAFSAPTIVAPETSPPPAASPAVSKQVVANPAPAVPAKPSAPTVVASVGSITVELPPARPAEHVQIKAQPLKLAHASYDFASLTSSVTVPLPPARPVPAAPKPAPLALKPAEALNSAAAPRLERLSSKEVALVTTGKPLWRGPVGLRTAAVSSVRWVALAQAGPRPNIQILNAARTEHLAASARTVLLDRGWRRIAIGDAPVRQVRSEVLYSRNRAALGRSLAAQFGVAARMVERDVLVLVLGRDAAQRITGQQES